MKREPSVQLTVKVEKDTAEQLKKLADYNNVALAEQLREFIDKGLAIKSYKQDIDFITRIIRQELMAIYNIDDIKAVVKDQNERVIKMLMKTGKLSSAEFFLMLKVIYYIWDVKGIDNRGEVIDSSIKLGIDYMQMKDFKINDFLKDNDYLIGLANHIGGDDEDY